MELHNECMHEHKLGFRSYLAESFPLGTKVCDHCGCDIHMNWFWRVLYVLTCVIGPGAVYLITVYRLTSILESIMIFGILWSLQIFLTWEIIRHGKYVLL